jgi:hypothetical protein
MERRGLALLGALAVMAATPATARAQGEYAPPMLTPAVARTVAEACPGTKQYADALVRGMNAAEAAAANAPFSRCANATRLFELQWKNDYGRIALAATQLSQGLLAHDPALVKRAADATQAWRNATPATDAEVRSWDAIPDAYYAATHVAVIQDDPPPCYGFIVPNAAYINVAARTGTAWIRTERAAQPPGTKCRGGQPRESDPFAYQGAGPGLGGSVPVIQPRPTPGPDEVLRSFPNPPPR